MTITTISDTHGKHELLNLRNYTADVLVHAGDFSNRGTPTESLIFLEWLNKQPFRHIILIAGNHDMFKPELFKEQLKHFPNIIYLQDSEVVIDGIKFYGSPYSNEFGNWAFMENDIQLGKIWDKIPDDTQVLVTHGPAYACHDSVKRAYGRDPKVGSKSLHYRKLALQGTLKLHVSGHIHEAYGTSEGHGWTNICPCTLNEKYQFTNQPVTVEI